MNNKLKELREKRGLSQAEVAQEIGISRQMYNKYERGDTEPSLNAIKALCALYKISYEELLDSADAPKAFPVYSIDQSFGTTAVESPAVSFGVKKATSFECGTENYLAKIMGLLPHLLTSEKSRLLIAVAQSLTAEVECKKAQSMKADRDKVYFSAHDEYEKGLGELTEFTEKTNFSTKGIKWTREDMHEI